MARTSLPDLEPPQHVRPHQARHRRRHRELTQRPAEPLPSGRDLRHTSCSNPALPWMPPKSGTRSAGPPPCPGSAGRGRSAEPSHRCEGTAASGGGRVARASRGRERTTAWGRFGPGCPTWSFGAASSATVRSGRAHNAHLPRGLRIGASGQATNGPQASGEWRLRSPRPRSRREGQTEGFPD